MLIPHPAVLRRLVEKYETARAEEDDRGGGWASPRVQDLAYTLCVSTGTRDVDGRWKRHTGCSRPHPRHDLRRRRSEFDDSDTPLISSAQGFLQERYELPDVDRAFALLQGAAHRCRCDRPAPCAGRTGRS